MPCRVKPDRVGLHGRPCKLQVEGLHVGGQAEGQQVVGKEKNGLQCRLSSPIVWSVHKHYLTQGSRAITQPSNN